MEAKAQANSAFDEEARNIAYQNCESDAENVCCFPRNKVSRTRNPRICLAPVLTILFGCIISVLIHYYLCHMHPNIKLSELENQDEIFMQLAKELKFTDSLMDGKLNRTAGAIEGCRLLIENVRGEANNTSQALEKEIKNNKETIRDLENKLQTLINSTEEMKLSFDASQCDTNEAVAHLEQEISALREEANRNTLPHRRCEKPTLEPSFRSSCGLSNVLMLNDRFWTILFYATLIFGQM